MPGLLTFACKSFGSGALCALGSIAVTAVAPIVMKAVKDYIEKYNNEIRAQVVAPAEDPDLC